MKKKKKKKKKKNFKKWIKNKTYLYVFCDSSQCYGGFKLGHRACSYARDPHLICISISKVGTTPEDSCLAAIRSQPGRPTGTSFCTEWCGGYNLLLTNLQLPLRALVSDTLRQRVATGASLKSARWRRKSCLELCGVVSYTGWNQCDLLLLSSSSSSSFFFSFFFFLFPFFLFFLSPAFLSCSCLPRCNYHAYRARRVWHFRSYRSGVEGTQIVFIGQFASVGPFYL